MTYTIYKDEMIIGHSKLELGDAPMSVAAGAFTPAFEFPEFESKQTSFKDEEGVTRWIGLTAKASDGQILECIDVVLIRYQYGDFLEFEVSVIGANREQYDHHFPHHNRTYEEQFK